MKTDRVALPWYESESDYLAVVAMLPADEGKDPITHAAFMAKIKAGEKNAQRAGIITVRVPINAITLKAWCDKNNLMVCRDAIAKYGIAKVADGLASDRTN
jgi:hypothetical protein